eukprot:1431895-Rhodomonas_salina.2
MLLRQSAFRLPTVICACAGRGRGGDDEAQWVFPWYRLRRDTRRVNARPFPGAPKCRHARVGCAIPRIDIAHADARWPPRHRGSSGMGQPWPGERVGRWGGPACVRVDGAQLLKDELDKHDEAAEHTAVVWRDAQERTRKGVLWLAVFNMETTPEGEPSSA